MKSYNNLWRKFISDENILEAIKNATKGKRKHPKWRELYENANNHIKDFKKAVFFVSNHHTPKEIYDDISRKKRIIIVPTMYEQVVHHMVVQILKPIIMKSMYEYAYGSLPGRGAHGAKKIMERWVRDNKNNKYVLKLDIKKYFESIPINIVKNRLSLTIRDKIFLRVLFNILEVRAKGLPLGFYTSQWLAMWYLIPFDHYVKEKLKAKYYMHYMDDIVILGSNKRKLINILYGIKEYLHIIGLKLNNRSQLYRFEYNGLGRDIDFMGFRFFRNRTILRKSIMFKMSRKAKNISKKIKATIYDLRQFISYLGWINSTNVYNVWVKRIKPFINLKHIKKRISNYDRRINQCLYIQKTVIA